LIELLLALLAIASLTARVHGRPIGGQAVA
jgi:hypothetical protein